MASGNLIWSKSGEENQVSKAAAEKLRKEERKGRGIGYSVGADVHLGHTGGLNQTFCSLLSTHMFLDDAVPLSRLTAPGQT